MTYAVRLARRAERGLRRIREGDPRAYRRLADTIRSLAEDPRPPAASRLRGVEPNAWRLRIGDYRIVYEIHDDEVVVVAINVAPRGEVYRDL